MAVHGRAALIDDETFKQLSTRKRRHGRGNAGENELALGLSSQV